MKVFRAALLICYAVSGLYAFAQSYPAPTPGDFTVTAFPIQVGRKAAGSPAPLLHAGHSAKRCERPKS